jgi:hypothetical protein
MSKDDLFGGISMEEQRKLLKHNKSFVKRRIKRFVYAIIPFLLVVCILFIIQYFK